MFSSIKEILEKLLNENLVRYKVGIKWKEIVGEFLCKNSSPAYIKDEILYIYTFSSTWLHHLSLMKEQMLEEVQKVVGLKVKNIRFLLTKREQANKIFESKGKEILYDISNIILSKEKQEVVKKISQDINDISIKEKFSRLVESAIKRNEFFTRKYIVSRETEVEI